MERIAPQWIVDNLEDTIDFYTNKIGFSKDWVGSKFAIVSKGNIKIMFRELQASNKKRPNRIPFIESGWHTNGEEAWDAYLWVKDVDELYRKIKNNKVQIVKEIQNSEYGNRDFEIEDNNGYILCFGSEIK